MGHQFKIQFMFLLDLNRNRILKLGTFDCREAIVKWAMKACMITAIFADYRPLKKLRMQLAWADQVVSHSRCSVIPNAALSCCSTNCSHREANQIGIRWSSVLLETDKRWLMNCMSNQFLRCWTHLDASPECWRCSLGVDPASRESVDGNKNANYP